jgi:hypothetical protein
MKKLLLLITLATLSLTACQDRNIEVRRMYPKKEVVEIDDNKQFYTAFDSNTITVVKYRSNDPDTLTINR